MPKSGRSQSSSHRWLAPVGIGEAQHDRFGLFGDIIYTKLSVGIDTPRGVLADRADVASETFAGLVGAGYSVLQGPKGNLDLVGGLRVWHVRIDLSFDGQTLDGRGASDSASWVDGMVGVRGRYASARTSI